MADRRDERFAVALTSAYVAAAGTLCWFHEIWRDEAQAWLLARDGGLSGILTRAAFEGTPGLWHLLLWPFAALGAPFAAAKLLNLLFASAAVAIVAARAPFSRPTKALFAFSYYMLYEYGVLARNYALTLALLFAAAALFEERERRPWAFAWALALLANSSLFGLAAAGSLAAAAKPRGKSAALTAAGLAAAVLQMQPWLGPRDSYADGMAVGAATRIAVAGVACVRAFVPEPSFAPALAVALAAAAYGAAAHQLRRQWRLLAGWAFFCAALLCLFVFGRVPALRHDGFLMAGTVAFVWAGRPKSRAFEYAWAACLALSLSLSFLVSRHELRDRFSNSEAMASFIRESRLQGPIAANAPVSVLAYLPGVKPWRVPIGEFATYMLPERETASLRLGDGQLLDRIVAHFGRERPYLLIKRRLADPAAAGYVLLHAEDGPVFGYGDETFVLYGPAEPKRVK